MGWQQARWESNVHRGVRTCSVFEPERVVRSIEYLPRRQARRLSPGCIEGREMYWRPLPLFRNLSADDSEDVELRRHVSISVDRKMCYALLEQA